MAVYLGNQLVGLGAVSYLTNENNQGESGNTDPSGGSSVSGQVLTTEEWSNLKSGISYRLGQTVTTDDIPTIINNLNTPYYVNTFFNLTLNNTIWTRPINWPNLDSLNLSFTGNDDFIYMTYRTGHIDDFFAFKIELVNTNNPATLAFGNIINGVFTPNANETYTINSNGNYYYYFDSKAEGYIVIKLTGQFKTFRLIGATSANNTPNDGTYIGLQQHLLERIAYVPNIINFYATNEYWGTYDLEREKIGNNTGAACKIIYDMYTRCYSLQELDLSAFNITSQVTSLSETFFCCTRLKTLNLSHWNVSNITNYGSTFSNCQSLQTLNISNWNVSNSALSMGSTWYNCFSLSTINGLNNFSNKIVKTLTSTFYSCRSLKDLSVIKGWDTSQATSGYCIFYGCMSIEQLDLSSWNINNFTRTDNMFSQCFSLKEIKFPTGLTKNLTTITSMFNCCYDLQYIDVSWLKMDGGTCVSIANLFYNCRSITQLNIPNNWNLSALNNTNYSHYQVFVNCYSLKTITGITNWDFRSSTTQSAASMFSGCHSLENLDISGWKLNSTTYASFFSNCHSLKTINISGFDFTNCTSVASMFSNCYSLTTLICPSTYNTSKITTTASMFYGCASLVSIPINFSLWDMTKITTMADMFAYCYSLKSINLNNLTLSACTTIATMFNYDYSLEEIQWDNWTIPKLTSTSPGRLLGDCWSLKKMVGFPPIKLAFSMVNTLSFPVEEFVTLFTNLATNTTTRTINMTTANINKLSAAQKAIATEKKWTLAN